jgi:hypothetical protein
MEKSPKEPKPLRDTCNNCGEKYKLKPKNALVIEYLGKPECNHIVCQCPNCSTNTEIYLAEGGDTIDRARETGLTIATLEWPSDDVFERFCNAYGIELIESRALTPREEKIVGFANYLLQSEVTVMDFV